jgi:hypothetical protein
MFVSFPTRGFGEYLPKVLASFVASNAAINIDLEDR